MALVCVSLAGCGDDGPGCYRITRRDQQAAFGITSWCGAVEQLPKDCLVGGQSGWKRPIPQWDGYALVLPA